MKILGDIGNTETKICLVNSKNKIIKKINFKTRNITLSILKNNFSKLNIKKTGTFNRAGLSASSGNLIFASGTQDNKFIVLNSLNGGVCCIE